MKGVSFKKKEKLSDRTGGVTIMQTATKKETALGIRQMAMIGVMTAVTCILFEKTGKSFWKQFGAMVLGTLVCYLFGTVWLCLQLNLDFIGGLGVGVIPYLPGDTAKIILAALIGPVIVKALKRAE